MVEDEARKFPEMTLQSCGHRRFVRERSLRMECQWEVSELQSYLRRISLYQLVQHVHGGRGHGTLQIREELERDRGICRTLAHQIVRDFGEGSRSPLFALDELLQLIERSCSRIGLAVDKECRRAIHTALFPFGLIGRDDLLESVAVQIFAEADEIEAQLSRITQEIVPLRFGLISEKQVVHLPELALLSCGQRSLMGELRVGVDAERKVLELDCGLNAFNALCLQFSKRLGKLRAIWALEVGIEDDLHSVRRRRLFFRSGKLSDQNESENPKVLIHFLCSEMMGT